MKKNEYVIPKGRLAKVSCIQNYAKTKRYTKLNSRQRQQDEEGQEYTTASQEFPHIHKRCPMLLNGKVRMNWTQNEIFENGTQVKPRKKPEVKLKYRKEDGSFA